MNVIRARGVVRAERQVHDVALPDRAQSADRPLARDRPRRAGRRRARTTTTTIRWTRFRRARSDEPEVARRRARAVAPASRLRCAALPAAQREAFLLHQEGGLELAEIAAADRRRRRDREEPHPLRAREAARRARRPAMTTPSPDDRRTRSSDPRVDAAWRAAVARRAAGGARRGDPRGRAARGRRRSAARRCARSRTPPASLVAARRGRDDRARSPSASCNSRPRAARRACGRRQRVVTDMPAPAQTTGAGACSAAPPATSTKPDGASAARSPTGNLRARRRVDPHRPTGRPGSRSRRRPVQSPAGGPNPAEPEAPQLAAMCAEPSGSSAVPKRRQAQRDAISRLSPAPCRGTAPAERTARRAARRAERLRARTAPRPESSRAPRPGGAASAPPSAPRPAALARAAPDGARRRPRRAPAPNAPRARRPNRNQRARPRIARRARSRTRSRSIRRCATSSASARNSPHFAPRSASSKNSAPARPSAGCRRSPGAAAAQAPECDGRRSSRATPSASGSARAARPQRIVARQPDEAWRLRAAAISVPPLAADESSVEMREAMLDRRQRAAARRRSRRTAFCTAARRRRRSRISGSDHRPAQMPTAGPALEQDFAGALDDEHTHRRGAVAFLRGTRRGQLPDAMRKERDAVLVHRAASSQRGRVRRAHGRAQVHRAACTPRCRRRAAAPRLRATATLRPSARRADLRSRR